jgi:hypothetical protein
MDPVTVITSIGQNPRPSAYVDPETKFVSRTLPPAQSQKMEKKLACLSLRAMGAMVSLVAKGTSAVRSGHQVPQRGCRKRNDGGENEP